MNFVQTLKLYFKKNNFYTFSYNDARLYLKERENPLNPLKLISRSDKLSLYEISRIKFYWDNSLDTNDLPWLFNEVFFDFKDNPSSYSYDKVFNNKLDWVIDAGACEGFFSLLSSKLNIKKIIALEPNPILISSLKKTFEINYNNASEFLTLQLGLGKNEDVKYINFDTKSVCQSMIIDNAIDLNSIAVKIKSLDNIIEDNGIKNGNGLIKMDVEGYEMEALLGSFDTLKNLKPKLAIAVYHDLHNANLCKEIILNANKSYNVEFRGKYAWESPSRPYMLYAY